MTIRDPKQDFFTTNKEFKNNPQGVLLKIYFSKLRLEIQRTTRA